MQNIVLASSNQGKLAEFNRLLNSHNMSVVAQGELNVPDADETGLTFVENAILKARNACAHTGLPAIADDSGLEVDALDGAPGIYSARFSGAGATDQINNAYLLEKLQNTPEHARTARYQCILVFMQHEKDPTPIICQGSWEGRILNAPEGEGGFGYDPLFWLEEYQCSAANLPYGKKNHVSHRAIAMQALLKALEAHKQPTNQAAHP